MLYMQGILGIAQRPGADVHGDSSAPDHVCSDTAVRDRRATLHHFVETLGPGASTAAPPITALSNPTVRDRLVVVAGRIGQ